MSPPYLCAGLGMVGAGLVLDSVQYWEVFTSLPELFIMVSTVMIIIIIIIIIHHHDYSGACLNRAQGESRNDSGVKVLLKVHHYDRTLIVNTSSFRLSTHANLGDLDTFQQTWEMGSANLALIQVGIIQRISVITSINHDPGAGYRGGLARRAAGHGHGLAGRHREGGPGEDGGAHRELCHHGLRRLGW